METQFFSEFLCALDPSEISRTAANAISVVQGQAIEALGPTNRVMIAHDLNGAHY